MENYIRTVFDNQCFNPIIYTSGKYRLVYKTKCQVTLRAKFLEYSFKILVVPKGQ